MTWLRQAAHVAAKDARMAWYYGVALVPLVLLWAFQVGGSLGLLWSLVLIFVALLALGLVVQADAAVRSDAFWVTLPLSPGAVLAGKLISAAAVLGLVLVGEGILLARHAAPGAEVVHDLLVTAASMAWLLCFAVLIGALTRDLRSFVLTLVLGLLSWPIGGAILTLRLVVPHAAKLPPWTWPLLIVTGSLAIAAYQYRTGRRLRAAVTACVFLGTVLVLSIAFQPNAFAGPSFGPPLERRLRPDSLIAARLVRGPGGRIQPGVWLRRVGGARQLEYTLTAASLAVRGRDGSLKNVPLLALPVPSVPVVPDVPGARWINVYAGTLKYAWANVNTTGPSLATVGGTPLRLDGEVQVARPAVGARLPLRPGASLARAGLRIRIVGFAVTADAVSIDVVASRVDEDADDFGHADRIPYALLDRAHATVYPLTQSSSSGGMGSFLGAGPRLTTEHLRLESITGETTAPTGQGPFDLIVIDWRVIGSYHVSLPVEVRVWEEPPQTAPALTLERSGTVTLPMPAH